MKKVILIMGIVGILSAKTRYSKLGVGIGNEAEMWKGAAILYFPVADYWSLDVKGFYGIQKGEMKVQSGSVSTKTTTDYNAYGLKGSFVANLKPSKDFVVFAGPSVTFGKMKATTEAGGVETEIEQSFWGIGGVVGLNMAVLEGWDFYASISTYGLTISWEESGAGTTTEYKEPSSHFGITVGLVKSLGK